MNASPNEVISFGIFEFHCVTGELRKDGRPIKIDPQAAKLLSLLLEDPGQLVPYQAIRDRLWLNSFVDYGKGIRRCLAHIREALGDDSKKPLYIETHRNQGCRFIAPVRTSPPKVQAAQVEDLAAGFKPSREDAQLSPSPLRQAPEAQDGCCGDVLARGTAVPRPGSMLSKYSRHLWAVASVILMGTLAVAILAPAYGLAMSVFSLGAVFVCLGYARFEDTLTARTAVAIYMIAAMSYISSASTMPDFQATVINVGAMPPAAAFLFVIGLKFIPLFVLVLAYWVILGWRGDAGFLANSVLGRGYILVGILFLVTEFICLAVASGDDRIWKADLPGRWTIFTGSVIVLAVNLVVWLVGLRCFRQEFISNYRFLFSFCAIAYLPIALGAFFIDDEHNRINQYYLDVRWPESYVAANPDAVNEFGNLLRGDVKSEVGADLAGLLMDAGFNEALRHGKFYKQHSDEPFQVLNRAVTFGYRRSSPFPHGRSPFITIRFPEDMADALRFQPVDR